MAVQFSPLVALIIGGAVTVAGGALIYNKYNTSKNVDPVPVVALQSKSPVKIKQESPVDKPDNAKLLLPEFGLLRVEEDGSVLVSGTTTPNSVVEIIQNETIFGKTKSASNGDFVVVFENQLKPGNYELYIRSTPKDGKTTLSVEAGIVVIPEEGGEMLAMVSKPDGPSKLIQVSKLEPKAEQRAMEVPKSEEKVKQQIAEKVAKVEQTKAIALPVENKVVVQKAVELAEAKVEPVKEAEAKVEKEVVVDKIAEVAKVEKETPPAVIVKKAEAPKSVEVAKLETKSVEEVKAAPVDVAKETPVEVVKNTPVEPVKETPVNEEKVALLKITPVEETKAKQDEVATVVPQLRPEKKSSVEKILEAEDKVEVQPKAELVKKTPPPVITKPVYLEAVEVENEKIFVAGTGHPKHIVNVYIDDKFIGNAKVNNQGIFLVESNSTLTVGNHTVRADMLGSANSTVVARAQVPLIHDLPETPKVVVDAPKEIVEAPKVAVVEVETPKAVEKTPIVVAETLKAVVETPKAVVEEPKVVLETPKAVVEEPKVVVETPKEVGEEPKVVVKTPKVVVETPKVVVETPKAVVEETKVVVETPKAVVETPKVVVETPKNIVVAKVQEAENRKPEVPAIEPANKKQTEKLPENKVVADGEKVQSATVLAVSKEAKQEVAKQEVAKLDNSTGSKISSAKSVDAVEEVVKLDTQPVDAKQLEVTKLEEKATKQITRKLVKNESEPVVEEVTPAKKNVVTKQMVATKQDVTVKQEEVVAVKPAPVVEKTSKPVQIAKVETKTPPVVKKEPKRVIRTSSSVIIRRGDNLWRISRRILGRGIRYSTIYQANRDQIKNPALIFPGQIFKVPEKMVDVDGNTKS